MGDTLIRLSCRDPEYWEY